MTHTLFPLFITIRIAQVSFTSYTFYLFITWYLTIGRRYRPTASIEFVN